MVKVVHQTLLQIIGHMIKVKNFFYEVGENLEEKKLRLLTFQDHLT